MDAASPERAFRCQKSERDIPLARPRCLNPRGFCRAREACPIHLLEKERARGR